MSVLCASGKYPARYVKRGFDLFLLVLVLNYSTLTAKALI